jgi:hypothetical protein
MRHIKRVTLTGYKVYTHCGETMTGLDLLRGTGSMCLACIRGREGNERHIQASYTELSTRKSTNISPFTRD